MIKMEMGERTPENFQESWPGELSMFSYLESLCAIPSALFAVTTRKDNGKPNVCLYAWGSFTSAEGAFYVVLPGAYHHGHNYRNIARDGQFVVNFITRDMFQGCLRTIEENQDETDEIAAGGFTQEAAQTLDCPRIRESFLCLECELVRDVKLTEDAGSSFLIGRVRHAALGEDWIQEAGKRYGKDGFLYYLPDRYLPASAERRDGGTATLSAPVEA